MNETNPAAPGVAPDSTERTLTVAPLPKVGNVIKKRRFYWLGALPTLPVESVTVAGICFPKMTETIHVNPSDPIRPMRLPRLGEVVALTDAEIERLAQSLPARVVRLRETLVEVLPAGVEMPTTARVERSRGQVIRLQGNAELEATGRIRKSVLLPDDQPLAAFLYLVPELTLSPRLHAHGEPLPAPISETGLRIAGPVLATEPNLHHVPDLWQNRHRAG